MRQRVTGKVVITMIVAMLSVAAGTGHAEETFNSDGGYIDMAAIGNQIRFRFDAGYNNPVPDRAEFFYPQLGQGSPSQQETNVDFQELEAYFESVLRPGLSVFAEVPVRFINPEQNVNTSGLSDVRAGFKYALIDAPDRALTFQLRGFFPSGDGTKGLGTEHYSIEPGLIFQKSNQRSRTFGEFKAWVPLDGSVGASNINPNTFVDEEFSGTILRFGLGHSFDLYQQQCCSYCTSCDISHASVGNRLSFVTEVVGWTILDGLKTNIDTDGTPGSDTATSADGDTIINLKLGLRWTTPRNSFYVGYGKALAGDVWYEDILRAEYSIRF